ncbi:hypothetical protein [Kaistella jeonii]|uniref:Uncharacterized protein n=1 Tax=Kaistella jeonii TaxID=266749 RepID=A0A0C1FMU3_9FLAO|nr:hypothetical protein [Kaistella jeonii]KIA89254.1 hypothetical protein OA86_06540 [Kaistella jeonii]SFC01168.1 hypothetical protein SAMN05421876_10526 [Kaistella jeonii]VEI96563.1 Uncharacterised protein [Kaistella jeonii]
MNKILLLGGMLCFQSLFSQVALSGNKLIKDGKTYKMYQYEQVFQKSEALENMKKARSNNTIASILGFGGGISLGFGIAQLIAHGKTRTAYDIFGNPYTIKPDNNDAWILIGAGAGLIVIAIPLSAAGKKKVDQAIRIENGETTSFKPYFKIENSGNGLALSYNF